MNFHPNLNIQYTSPGHGQFCLYFLFHRDMIVLEKTKINQCGQWKIGTIPFPLSFSGGHVVMTRGRKTKLKISRGTSLANLVMYYYIQ